MPILCTLQLKGSDSLIQEVNLLCVPDIGQTLYLDGNVQAVVDNIYHEISATEKIHKIIIQYTHAS